MVEAGDQQLELQTIKQRREKAPDVSTQFCIVSRDYARVKYCVSRIRLLCLFQALIPLLVVNIDLGPEIKETYKWLLYAKKS
jgi:hypothetical protein